VEDVGRFKSPHPRVTGGRRREMMKKRINNIPKKPTTDSILAAMRDAVQEKDALIEQIIKENLKLKELLRKGDNDEPSD